MSQTQQQDPRSFIEQIGFERMIELGLFFEQHQVRAAIRKDARGDWRCEMTTPGGSLHIGVSPQWAGSIVNAVTAVKTRRFLVGVRS